MENNKKIRDLSEIYLELRHDVFEEKIKKPMEICLHDSGNVFSINSLNTIIANAVEKSKLGEAGFDEHDIFSPPSFEEEIYFDDTLSPVYDDYNDSGILVPPTIVDKIIVIMTCLLYMMFTMINLLFSVHLLLQFMMIIMMVVIVLLLLLLMKLFMLMWRVMILLCMWLMIRMFYMIVILLILFMMLLKVIMREGNMVLCISTILSFPSLC